MQFYWKISEYKAPKVWANHSVGTIIVWEKQAK